jgi:hypothetical protein
MNLQEKAAEKYRNLVGIVNIVHVATVTKTNADIWLAVAEEKLEFTSKRSKLPCQNNVLSKGSAELLIKAISMKLSVNLPVSLSPLSQ